MKKKGLWKFYPIGLLFLFFLFFYIRGKRNGDTFFSSKINSKIVSQNKWQIRATEFDMGNGLRIVSSIANKIDLQIGDSIVKNGNSWEFDVFKKDGTGQFIFDKSYSLKK